MQKDLFGTATVTPIPNTYPHKASFLERHRFTLKLDQVIFILIGLLIASVLIFSFGVESGKRYAMSELKAERAKRERMAQELGEKIFANSANAQASNPYQPVSAQAPAAAVGSQEPAAAHPAVSAAYQPSAASAITPATSAPAIPVQASLAPQKQAQGKYAVQVITFTSKASAEQHVKKLVSKGYQGMILPKGKYQLVCVAGFETRDKATKALSQLKSDGLAPKDAYIRAMPGA